MCFDKSYGIMNTRKSIIAGAAAALIASFPPAADACSNILVTKGASKDGSCLVSYAADSHQLFGELYFRAGGYHESGQYE